MPTRAISALFAARRDAALTDAARVPEWSGFNTEECKMEFKVEGDKLTITIDVSKKARDAAPPSTSGKSNVLASTRGFTGISTPAGLVKLGLNVTT